MGDAVAHIFPLHGLPEKARCSETEEGNGGEADQERVHPVSLGYARHSACGKFAARISSPVVRADSSGGEHEDRTNPVLQVCCAS